MTVRARIVGVTCISVFLTACGSGGSTPNGGAKNSSPGAGDRSGAQTSLIVGSSPVLANASLYFASENGAFAKNHLSVTPTTVASGQQAIPRLLSGEIQFTAADPLGAIQAIAHNVPLVIVAPASYVPSDPARDTTGLLVNGGSSVTNVPGLKGRTIAVNAIGGFVQLAAKASIDQAGGDSSSIKWVEVPLQSIVAAVQSGRVDGGVDAEPFVTQGKSVGLRDILAVTSKALAGVPSAVYVTSKAYAASHPQIVKAFAASLYAANAALAKDPNQVRAVGAKSTSVPIPVLAKIVVPVFQPRRLTIGALDKLQTLMVKYRLLPAQVNLSPHMFGVTQ
jgi:NitT/TauT family transport system substrate-binding protein